MDIDSNVTNSNDNNRKDQINKCMLLLQSHTKDEEKFVALLILPKLLNPNDKELMTIVFKEIDFKFLRRLLISEYTDNESNSQPSLYKMISLNIISSFCYYSEFLNDKRILKTIPYMISLLNENEDAEVLNEILDIFILFTNNERTLKEISASGNIEKINQLILNSNIDEIKEKGIKILTIISQSNQCNSIVNILHSLSCYFININSAMKFKILELFVVLFTNPNLNVKSLEDNSLWLINIKKGLKTILSSKLGTIQNDNCLILISSLIRINGIYFFFPKEESNIEDYIENGDKKIKLMGNLQFLTLVMHLACTETRVLLDDYKDEDDMKKMEFKDEEEKSKIKNNQKRIQEILPICFEIIEFMINILVQYSEYDNEENTIKDNVIYKTLKNNNINSKWILSFREALSETILALMEFITEKVEMYKETQEIEKIDNMIVLLSSRVLSSWLSEDIEMYEKEIKYVIPALIELVKIRPKSIDFIPINNISLVFSEITANEEFQEIFINQEGIKTLFNILEDNSTTINENTLLNILISMINIVMLKPDHIKSNKTQWKKIIKYYNKYSYTKASNITLYSYLIVIELSIIKLIESECSTEDEKIIIENSVDYIINFKDSTDDSIRNLWSLSFLNLSELSKINTNVGKILLLNTAKLVTLTKDPSLSDLEKQYLNTLFDSIRKVSKC